MDGQYDPAYLYANPKIHKSKEDPPLRPVISQIGAVTYDISKKVNYIVSRYIPRKFCFQSPYEFLTMLRATTVTTSSRMFSMDVENLFTNIPIAQTIEIVLKNVYHNEQIPPPKIPESIMEKLLYICTTECPFTHVTGEIYIQKDGVSMGNCLGPTFAEFYMCNLENSIFNGDPTLLPCLYARYVDNMYILKNDGSNINNLIEKFKQNTVLNFTHEF